ncbi:hypothetical protein GWI33_011031, partial [Rhynchophorus ferrugineus]
EQLKSKYPQQVISDSISQSDEPLEVTSTRDHLSSIKSDAVRAHNDLNAHKINPIVNWAYDFWPVLAVVLVVRSFFFEPFNIPSESMNPTLETGDFILVNKFAYGVRLPLLNNKIIDIGEPQHGDVAVFRYPLKPSISYIKRIIGLPGDVIAYRNGELFINGEKQPHQLGAQVSLPVSDFDAQGQEQKIDVQAQQWVVNIAEHRFITQYIKTEQSDAPAQQFVDQYQQKVPLSLLQNWEVTVPEGQYFAMGDNRDQSADSRYWGFQVISDSISQSDEPLEVTSTRDHLSSIKSDAVRAHNDLNAHKINPIVNWAYDFWPVLAVVLVVRSFFFEPFNIPSESMNPTLETGDFILVNKFAYGVRLPLLNNKIIDIGEPQHGDVAVFRYPLKPSISYIKRIIGLPGDVIAYRNGELFINGEKQPHQLGAQVSLPVSDFDAQGQEQKIDVQAQQWVVNIAEHRFITQYIKTEQSDAPAQQFVDQYQQKVPLSLLQNWEVTVPEGQYFAMGDNRDQSADSRYWGFVPEANLT